MSEKLETNIDENTGPTDSGDDTEGHYLANYEFGRQVERDRRREFEQDARASKLRRETKPKDRR